MIRIHRLVQDLQSDVVACVLRPQLRHHLLYCRLRLRIVVELPSLAARRGDRSSPANRGPLCQDVLRSLRPLVEDLV